MHLIEDSLGLYFEKQVAVDPDHEFIVYPDRNLRFTYGQFNERVNNLAKGLLAIGIKKGDHVGIWAKNVPDWLTFMFATSKIGVVLVTVNTAYKSHEVEYVLKQSDMKALALIDSFRDVDYLEIVYELVPELKNSERGRLKSKSFPYLQSVIYVGQEKTEVCTTPTNFCSLEAIIQMTSFENSWQVQVAMTLLICSTLQELPVFRRGLC
jgi:fatty-acyl-CoA synthase